LNLLNLMDDLFYSFRHYEFDSSTERAEKAWLCAHKKRAQARPRTRPGVRCSQGPEPRSASEPGAESLGQRDGGRP
jgi:hypothetical protein